MFRFAAACAAFLAAFIVPVLAFACGGFFCGQAPVEQNAERILFEVGDDSVTAVVDIRYTGSPDDFSWILPLSGDLIGELELVPSGVLSLMELATVPQLLAPPTRCSGGGGGGLPRSAVTFSDPGGVDVTELDRVGPFEPVLVSSEDPDELVEWLNTNGYLVTEAMEPFIDDYVSRDFSFLAMTLAPDAGTRDIAPIAVTYSGNEPMIPLMLTSVASEPEMGVLVFVLANQRYESRNYGNLEVPLDQLQAHPTTGQTNYYPLISFLIDQEDGRAFVTEFAGTSSDTFAFVQNQFLPSEDLDSVSWLQNALTRRTTVTRLFARMGGWEMTMDPSFQPSGGGAVSRTLDLTDRPAIDVCGPGPGSSEVPCGDTYCGVGATCATTVDDVDGCVCPDGQTAQSILAPATPGGSPVPTVTCRSADFDFLADVIGTDGGPADPCFADPCGASGSCVAVNGFATCACDDGFAAVPNGVGGVRCVLALARYEPEQLLWPAGCSGQSCSTSDRGTSVPAALLFTILVAPRRRRRSL